MNKLIAPAFLLALALSPDPAATAHPSSGIVINDGGNVFFQDAVGRCIWKIDPAGKLTKYYDKLGGHWMALDAAGAFAQTNLKLVERITPAGEKPALIVADGGAPIAVCGDGRLYYGLAVLEGDRVAVGVTRVAPDNAQSIVSEKLNARLEQTMGLTGLAPGPEGSLYIACPSAVLKVLPDGSFATIVEPVKVEGGEEYPADNNPSPYLRGLAVDPHGVVYAAATGRRCVIKITPAGKVETVLEAKAPWSPTGVAWHDGALYVLEYTNANDGRAEGWTPRVRKLAADGTVSTLATVDHAE